MKVLISKKKYCKYVYFVNLHSVSLQVIGVQIACEASHPTSSVCVVSMHWLQVELHRCARDPA